MNKLLKWICLMLVAVLMLPMVGCKKKVQPSAPIAVVDIEDYLGTWQSSAHDGEKVVHYLIFDEDGYWNVHMNYPTLTRAIRQKPDQLVSFAVFCELQNSKHTGCHYEYVDDATYTERFYIDDEGNLVDKEDEEVVFAQISKDSGEPTETMKKEAADLFDRAREEALGINKE